MLAFPNGKINVGLHVLEKRQDGFHSIETGFYPIGWTDALEIVRAEGDEPGVEFRSSGLRVFGTKENNLCLRAYNLLSALVALPPVKIHLHKTIPVGAGLGGGSSDAAATLVQLNRMIKNGLDIPALKLLASQLGSDCTFFIDNKPSLATGKGDQLEPLALRLKNYFIVIVKPRVHISTSDAYRHVKPHKRRTPLQEILSLPVSEWKDKLVNDFEDSVFEKYPGIKNIKKKLYANGAVYASMSGSGSAVYGLFREEKNLKAYFRSCTLWQGWMLL